MHILTVHIGAKKGLYEFFSVTALNPVHAIILRCLSHPIFVMFLFLLVLYLLVDFESFYRTHIVFLLPEGL